MLPHTSAQLLTLIILLLDPKVPRAADINTSRSQMQLKAL
jgi:hypothetical protein